jgi:hypothetical protein
MPDTYYSTKKEYITATGSDPSSAPAMSAPQW